MHNRIPDADEPARLSAQQLAALERELTERVRGETRFDALSRAIYSTDASIYEIVPAGVVLPRSAADVAAAVRTCVAHGAPLTARGAGTGIAGGALGWGVQLDLSKYLTGIDQLDPQRRTVRVEAGVVLDDLNAALAPHGLHFPPDVATSSRATIGGMIANNSCGAHSVYYGRTVDYVEALEVVLADGSQVVWEHAPFAELPPRARDGRGPQAARVPYALEQRGVARRHAGPHPTRAAPGKLAASVCAALDRIRQEYRDDVFERYPRVLRRNGGYALDRLCASQEINPATLICGSEGTLAIVTAATLRLAPLPKLAALVVAAFDDVLDAVGATPGTLKRRPAAVELIDHRILEAGLPQIPPAVREAFVSGAPRALLICELYDEDDASLRARIDALAGELREAAPADGAVRVVFDPAAQAAVWDMRKKGFGLLMSQPGDEHPLEFIEDAAVDPDDLRDYVAELNQMLADEGVREVSHYAHASVGLLHVRPVLNLRRADDVRRLRRVAQRTTELVLKYGGAMTGEHGDGIVRSEWLERMYGPRITQAFREVKQAFDPAGVLNPRKIVDPLPMDQRLRAAAAVVSLPTTRFDYGRHGGMAELAGMCSGVGQCRQKLVGVMCPSYVATLDERHTTRARANALRIALSDRGLLKGLDDPALDEVMDLCLSCKACKSECPTGVDMARLKAEWLAHRNQARGAGRSERFFAHAERAARWASLAPWLANPLLGSRWLRAWLERRYGLDRRITPPALAPRTFHHWFAHRHGPQAPNGAQAPSPATGPQTPNGPQAPSPATGPQTRSPASGGPKAGEGACGPRKRRGRVVYFADTWMNYYWPQVGVAAVRLLEAAGYEVLAPRLACCGRPLISKGFLDQAAALARQNVARLAPLVAQGAWIVGSEPSCVLTLMDEYPHFVRTPEARQIAPRVRLVDSLLAEALADEADAIEFAPKAGAQRRVLYHGHCHQKALVGVQDTLTLLNAPPGLTAAAINSGCCGMAGSFGHEAGHYDVARAIGEQRLFPAVRARGSAEVAVAGFSCREQLAHHAGVTARHALELVAAELAS